MRSRYIAFEGIDGAGKDTQLKILADRLERAGVTPIVLHEPSYGVFGQKIRSVLFNLDDDIEKQRELFTADRKDHVQKKIAPLMSLIDQYDDFAVIQNRSLFSAAAYQPRGDSDAGLVQTIEAELKITPMPDLVIVLDVTIEVALKRISEAGIPDSLERHDRLANARDRYLRLCKIYDVCRIVSAVGDPQIVAENVLNQVMRP